VTGLAAARRWAAEHLGDPLYTQSYLMLASTAVSAGTGLVFWVLAARMGDARTVGLGAGLIAAVSFLSYLTSFALPYGMLRFARVAEHVSRVVNISLWFSALTSVAAAVVFAAGAPFWSPKLHGLLDGRPDVALFALAGAGAAVGLLVDNALAARRRSGVALARNAVAGVGKLVLLPLLLHLGPLGVFLAMTLPMAVSAVAVVALLPRLVPGYSPWDLRGGPDVRALFDFSLRNYPGALASGAPTFLLPVIAVNLLSARENAFFYVAWSIGQAAQLVPSVVSNLALSEGATEGAGRSGAKAERFVLTLLAPGCAAATLAAGPLLAMYGPDYAAGATWPLRCFVVSAVPWALVVISQSRLRLDGRYRDVTGLTLLFCALSLGLPLTLGHWLGLDGIGLGWLAATALTALPVAASRRRPARQAAGAP
jgi:O-antigen/teichoic acid export membrane protein